MRTAVTDYQLPVTKGASRGLQPARTFGVAVALLCFAFGGACSPRNEKQQTVSGPPIARTAIDGGVTLTLTVTPGELVFTERAEVLVEVSAPKDVVVEVAEYDRAQEHVEHQFEYRLIRGERQAAVPMAEGKLRWSYRYALEFFLPGDYELPAAVVSFTGSPSSSTSDGDVDVPAPRQVKTDPIAVAARDPHAAPMSSEELRNIATLPPVELPGIMGPWWWLLLAGAVALVATIVLLRRRGGRRAVEIHVPAHEWARRQIAALVADDLIRKERIQEFYYRISGIVRGYIERRFGVSAPEMTTEEFLVAAASDGRFGPQHARDLNEFLTACDLVKYARQIPHSIEADRVLKAAGAFVERTRADTAPEAQAA
jgi:hypothetical protein